MPAKEINRICTMVDLVHQNGFWKRTTHNAFYFSPISEGKFIPLIQAFIKTCMKLPLLESS